MLKAILAGIGSVLSFGWPLGQVKPINDVSKTIFDDWQRNNKDINKAIEKYKLEKKNV